MDTDIFVSIDAENHIVVGHHLYFAVSSLLNATALYCLFKEAPEMQSEIKFFLYYMQGLTFLLDVILDVTVEPITLLPAFGGYCKGILCKWISIRVSLLITFFLVTNIGFGMLACIWRRHQAIVKGRFKFGKVANNVFIVFTFALSCAPSIFGLFADFNDSESELLIDQVHAFNNLSGIGLIAHILWYIRQGSKRSAQSTKRITRALFVLVIQLGVPFTLVSLPGLAFVRCLMEDSSLTFGVCYSCVVMVNTHSIFHSVVLLAITPAYRRFIARLFLRIFCQKNAKDAWRVGQRNNSQTSVRGRLQSLKI